MGIYGYLDSTGAYNERGHKRGPKETPQQREVRLREHIESLKLQSKKYQERSQRGLQVIQLLVKELFTEANPPEEAILQKYVCGSATIEEVKEALRE